jgi:hypothetical protein
VNRPLQTKSDVSPFNDGLGALETLRMAHDIQPRIPYFYRPGNLFYQVKQWVLS